MGEHLPLSDDRVLLDPRVFAKMLDALDVQNSDLVLDVGCGFGYSSAVIGQIAEAVVALEDDASLVKEASATTQEIGADNVAIIEGPLHEGAAAHGPYDAVILQGGVEEIPTALLDQIKDGGRIIATFMEGAVGSVRLGIKSAQRVSWRSDFDATAPRLPGFNKSVAFSL